MATSTWWWLWQSLVASLPIMLAATLLLATAIAVFFLRRRDTSTNKSNNSKSVGKKETLSKHSERKPATKAKDSDDEDEDDLNLVCRYKQAQQKTITRQIEEAMSPEDMRREKMIETQQLSKIYALLRENEDKFGKVSFNQVKEQMAMYKSK